MGVVEGGGPGTESCTNIHWWLLVRDRGRCQQASPSQSEGRGDAHLEVLELEDEQKVEEAEGSDEEDELLGIVGRGRLEHLLEDAELRMSGRRDALVEAKGRAKESEDARAQSG